MLLRSLVTGLVLLSLQPGCYAFKANDFKTCADSAFCTRLRGASNAGYEVLPKSVSVKGPIATARLHDSQSKAEFELALTAHTGVVRVHVTEPDKKRFEVPDVLISNFVDAPLVWTNKKSTSKSLSLQLGSAAVTIQYQPFKLSLALAGKPAVELNSRSLFAFEHLREKQEGDPAGWWEETFKSHQDSKPKGPEAISLDLSFPGAQHVYGLPEHADTLSLRTTIDAAANTSTEPLRLYNLDVFEYDVNSAFGLYGAIPLMVAHTAKATVGAFWLNAAEMYIDVEKDSSGTHTQWVAESGILDLFLLLGPTPAQVSKQYSQLTGTTAMPQLFALGYHQCRWNYRDEADVAAVNQGFDDFDIPYDVIWLDIEYTDGKRYFTWDKAHFPHPEDMQKNLADHQRKLVAIIDPHIKQDANYYVQTEGAKRGCFVKDKTGHKDFDGWCWPGSSYYFDSMSPDARKWWEEQFQLTKWQGSTTNVYLWNDMNEPSVFNGPEVTMPKDVTHFGGWENRDVHNVYGMLVHKATADGMIARGKAAFGSDGDRPFVLSRSFFAGTQRYGAIWTGDNAATWEHLRISVPMLLSISLAGLPFCGADVGGFFGNPDAELAVRWWQLGAFTPFFRGHGHLDTKRREPWLFGEPHTTHVRAAIRQRYALLPYLYTLFRDANLHGLPVMRPLWYEFPAEEELFALEDAFLLGPSMLVAPVLEAGATSRTIYLPKGSNWYNAQTGELVPGKGGEISVPLRPDSIPSFVRGGSILPLQERPRRSSVAMHGDPYTLIIALDSRGQAIGQLYLDDGKSFAFERGIFAHRHFTFRDNTLTNAALPDLPGQKSSKGYQPQNEIERIIVLGMPSARGRWQVSVEGGSSSLEAAAGPVALRTGLPDAALVVRKPGLKAGADWSVSFALMSASA